MPITIRKLKKALTAITLIGAAILVLAAIGIFVQYSGETHTGGDFQIYVLDNGVHTDLVLPVRTARFDWQSEFPMGDVVTARPGDTIHWLAFGWGERDFYLKTPTLNELTIGAAVHSLFFSDQSLIHISGYTGINEQSSSVRTIHIQADQLDLLTSYVRQSFARDKNGRVVRAANGYSNDDAFFQAIGSYAAWNTCNQWTTGALRQAHLPTPLWGGSSFSVMWHLKGLETGAVP